MTMQISDVAMIRRAQSHFAAKQYQDAEVFCKDLLRRHPTHYQALLIVLEMAWNRGLKSDAFECAQKMVKAYPRDGFAHARLAELYNSTGRHREAVRLLERFLERNSTSTDAINALARAHEFEGEIDKAVNLLEPSIVAGTETPAMALRYASLRFEQKQFDRAIEISTRHLGNPAVAPGLVEELQYLIGRAYEARGEFDKAFAAYAAANAVLPPEGDIGKAIEDHDRLLKVFSADSMRRLPRCRNESRLPVFIVCRPRSGSTLVERIIAAHPKVHAGGESEILKHLTDQMNLVIGSSATYPDCVRDLDQHDVDSLAESMLRELQALAPKAARITNKHLGTWKHLGLISLLCPSAVVIDLRRDPVDNCLGIFTSQLQVSRSFTRDFRQIAKMHREYERVMGHWKSVLDMPILTVNYEDIVADQETWTRRIIDFCGLEWDDRCLRFHEKGAQQSTTAAPTLSHKQVRQPIYKSSVSRATKFEKHLGPLYEGLGIAPPIGNGGDQDQAISP